MAHLTESIVSLIRDQFPAFYQQEGPDLIQFVKDYVSWMQMMHDHDNDSHGANPWYILHNIKRFKDVDRLHDDVHDHDNEDLHTDEQIEDLNHERNDLLDHKKEKFLKGVQFNDLSNRRMMIKKALELYRAKGTERAFLLFFQLLFAELPDFYLPKTDIFSTSSGKWYKPIYLELSASPRIDGWIGLKVRGQFSGASAVVQRIYRKIVNGQIINVVIIDDLVGNFQTGEMVTDDGIFEQAPRVVGSLTRLVIVLGGDGHSVGDTVKIISNTGFGALARVASVEEQDKGQLTLSISDGGWGFVSTTTDEYEVNKIANLVLYCSDPGTSNLSLYEQVRQRYYTVTITSASGNPLFYSGDQVNLHNQANTIVGNATIMSWSGNTTVLRPLTGNSSFLAANSSYRLYKISDAALFANVATVVDGTAQANLIAWNSHPIGGYKLGLLRSNGQFVTTNNNLLEFLTSNASASVNRITLNTITSYASMNLIVDTGMRAWYDVNRISVNTMPSMVVVAGTGTFSNAVPANYLRVQGNNNVNGTIAICNTTHIVLYANTNGTFSNTQVIEQVNAIGGAVLANGTITVFYPSVALVDMALNQEIQNFGNQVSEIVNGNTTLLEYMNFQLRTVGAFSRLTNINPGLGYNDSAPVSLFNPGMNSLNLDDFRFTFANGTSGSYFANGELVFANTFRTHVTLTLSSNSGLRVYDRVYQDFANGVEFANGFIFDISGNTVTLDVTTGTFLAGNLLHSNTVAVTPNTTAVSIVTTKKQAFARVLDLGNFETNIGARREYYYGDYLSNTSIDQIMAIAVHNAGSDYTNSAIVTITGGGGSGAVANVVTFSNGSINYIEIANCGNGYTSVPSVSANVGTGANLVAILGGIGFKTGLVLSGVSSGARAVLTSVDPLSNLNLLNLYPHEPDSLANNALINASATFANGTIVTLEVLDSGFGYANGETVTLYNIDRSATTNAIAVIINEQQGIRAGSYESTNGFVSGTKHLHDGEYYQIYSYEIRSRVPFDQYEQGVRDILHTAGTKLFGKLRIVTEIDEAIDVVESNNISAASATQGFLKLQDGGFLKKQDEGFIELQDSPSNPAVVLEDGGELNLEDGGSVELED